MYSSTAKYIARTGLLLAFSVLIQQINGVSQFITGPLINAILILSVLAVHVWSGIAIAVLSPIAAYILSAAPILKLVPQMIPIIMIGNALLAVCAWLFRNGHLFLGLAIGSSLKALFLWLSVTLVVLPFFGTALKPAQQAALSAMFSYNQLITATIGSILALLVWNRLRKTITA